MVQNEQINDWLHRELQLRPTEPTIPLRAVCGHSAEYWRSLGVVFVRPDFVGSKREMSPNRARHLTRAVCLFDV